MAAEDDGGRLLKAVQAVAISPKNAKEIVSNYREQVKAQNKDMNAREEDGLIADKLISRYAKLAGGVGGGSALSGVVPGIGTAVAALGGGAADAVVCMKLQVDLTMCIAEAYGYDLNDEDAQHLSFVIAATGSLEKAGVAWGGQVASKAGVRLVRQYLKGATL